MNIEFVNIEKLKPYKNNARIHSDDQVRTVADSIRVYGFTNPILFDASGLIAGHCRVMAAKLIYDQGGTIKLPNGGALPGNTVPAISCEGWPDSQRKAYIIADNKIALLSEWDNEVLRAEMLTIEAVDLKTTGFSDDEIKGILGEFETVTFEAQAKLDQKKTTTCPECGHEF